MRTSFVLLLVALLFTLAIGYVSAGAVIAKPKTCKNTTWNHKFKCTAHKKICKVWKRHPRKCIGHVRIPHCKKWKHRKGQCKQFKTFKKCKWTVHKSVKCHKVKFPTKTKVIKCKRVGKKPCKKYHIIKKCNKWKKQYKCVKHPKIIKKIRVCKKRFHKKHGGVPVLTIVKKGKKHGKKGKKNCKKGKKRSHKRCFFKTIVRINKKKCLKRKVVSKKCCGWSTKKGKCKVYGKRKRVCKPVWKRSFVWKKKCKPVFHKKCHKISYKKCVKKYRKNKCAIKYYKKGRCNKWKKGKKYCAAKGRTCVKRCQFAK